MKSFLLMLPFLCTFHNEEYFSESAKSFLSIHKWLSGTCITNLSNCHQSVSCIGWVDWMHGYRLFIIAQDMQTLWWLRVHFNMQFKSVKSMRVPMIQMHMCLCYWFTCMEHSRCLFLPWAGIKWSSTCLIFINFKSKMLTCPPPIILLKEYGGGS